MDPLSTTLAVISLATAVKDLVELGQKVHKSFAKVSDNLRNAERAAEDVKEMIEEIQIFCKDHEDALDGMKDFRLALQGLLGKLQMFEISILPLLPQAGGSRRHRLFRGWEVWRNCNKIEGYILDIQSDTVKVTRRYMMKGTMRAEVKLEKIHQETSRGLTAISQGLEVLETVRRDVSVIRITTSDSSTTHGPYESSASTSDDFDRHVVTFAQSTLSASASAPTLRTPDVITEEPMTAAYIKLQINHIVLTLDEISKLPVPTPNDVANFDMYLPMAISGKITDLRHFIVRQVLDIRDLFDAGTIKIDSIQEGASQLNNLSIALGALHMGTESIQLSAWAIKLARTLVASSVGHPELRAALGLYLSNQSVQYYKNGDKTMSLQAIQEAYTITLNLRNQVDGGPQFQILYSDVLMRYAQQVHTQRSIEMLTDAVQALEGVLDVQGFAHSQTPERPKGVLESSPFLLDRLFSSEPPIIAVSNYALALQILGMRLFRAGHSERAVNLQLTAITIRRKMVSIHGHKYKGDLANVLSSVVQDKNAKGHISEEILVGMADECIQLLRELAEYNPLSFTRRLINVLRAKAEILGGVARNTEAIATWEEVVTLAEQLLKDSSLCASALYNLSLQFRQLKRHDDAVRTMTLGINAYQFEPEIQAPRYVILSWDLGRLRRYTESAEAVRKAVALYRRMAMSSPETQTAALTASLSDLAHYLAASGDYSESLIAWKESVNILDNFVNSHPDPSSTANKNYLAALRTHTLISYILEDEEGSLNVSRTAARYFLQLSGMCHSQNSRINVDFSWAEFCYAYNLLRVGRLQELQQYIEDCIEVWKEKSEAIPNSDIMKWHAAMIALKSRMFDAQGRTAEALLVNQQVYNIVRPSVDTHYPCSVGMIKSMLHSAQLHVDLGNNEEALNVAEEALQLARDDQLVGPTFPTPARSLHGVASTALFCHNYERAIEVAREGCVICASPSWQDEEGEFRVLLRPSLLAILSSAEANLGRYSTAVEYAHLAVDASLDARDRKLDISPTTAAESYIETRGYLADILLATGDSVQARQICEERRAYFSQRVELRMGEYRDLAPILRMLGILCCSQGRHEEGGTAAQELLQIMKSLGSAFPSLQDQVKIRLRRQAAAPGLKVLDDMNQKLDCEHQTEVASLFAA